jgi:hypothetical protein
MVPVNILYNTTTGRILSASVNAIAPIPVGHAIVVKTLEGVTAVYGKRIEPVGQELKNKHYLKVDSLTTVPVATVIPTVFSKHDGESNALKNTVGDNESVQVSARQPDYSFNAAFRRAFFDLLQTALISGVGQVKLACGAAPGKERIVIFNDTLKPVFGSFTYV